MFRKIFALALTLGLMLTLTACGGDNMGTGNNTATGGSTTPNTTTNSAAADTNASEIITTAPGEVTNNPADTDPFTT